MKNKHIKLLKPCYGNKKVFMKIKECESCQFKKRCLLLCNGKHINDVIN